MAQEILQAADRESTVPAAGKSQPEQKTPFTKIVEVVVRMSALAFLLYWCINILLPFSEIAVWGVILAIAIYPAFRGLKRVIGGSNVIAAIIIGVLFLSILIVPAVWLAISTGASVQNLATEIRNGNIAVPPPDESVKTFPLVGKPVYEAWSLASTNMAELISQYKTQIIAVGAVVVGLVASTGKGLLIFILSIIVSAVILVYSKSGGDFSRSLFVRLAGERGLEMASIAETTVRNVTRGILGVAFIQSLLAGIGMLIAGVPFAGLWTLICLVLATVQVGLLPISLGSIIWAWMHMSTLSAILFTAWMLFVGVVDNILKPIMLGKGAPVPMLVVFLGAIGGFIFSGFIGLFTGAIVLSLGYKLFIVWMEDEKVL